MTAFDTIASTYDSAPNPLLALEERILGPLIPDTRGLSVADIGAGTGRWLHRLQASRSVAIDISRAMLAYAPPPRVIADAHSLPFADGAFDVVFCTFTLGYAPACFPELARLTAKTLVVTDVHPDAVARGWSRMAPHQPYTIESLIHPSLTRTHFLEPHIDQPERALFASKPHLYEAACEHPAIFIGIWNKQ
jgi:malonyl-CoA O-methyltransferase